MNDLQEKDQAQRVRKTHCKRGHEFATHATVRDRGRRVCRMCDNVRKRAKRKYAALSGLVVASESRGSAIIKITWITRRAKFGASGMTAEGRAASSASSKARLALYGHPMAKRTHCKRGHAFTRANTFRTKQNHRICKACKVMRRRPQWITCDGVRVNLWVHDRYYWKEFDRLKADVVNMHPDKKAATGRGTAAQFISAKRSLGVFLAREVKWYAQMQVAMPKSRRVRLARPHRRKAA